MNDDGHKVLLYFQVLLLRMANYRGATLCVGFELVWQEIGDDFREFLLSKKLHAPATWAHLVPRRAVQAGSEAPEQPLEVFLCEAGLDRPERNQVCPSGGRVELLREEELPKVVADLLPDQLEAHAKCSAPVVGHPEVEDLVEQELLEVVVRQSRCHRHARGESQRAPPQPDLFADDGYGGYI